MRNVAIRDSDRTADAALHGAASAAKTSVLAMMAALIMACSAQPSLKSTTAPQTAVQSDPAQRWIGKGVDEMERELGPPTEVIPVQEDRGGGGKIFLYANPGQPHMVFQTDPGSQTINKAEMGD
jgi:hypothetical protein